MTSTIVQNLVPGKAWWPRGLVHDDIYTHEAGRRAPRRSEALDRLPELSQDTQREPALRTPGMSARDVMWQDRLRGWKR